MDSFGDLLRFGTFQVVKGDSGKDNEREVCHWLVLSIITWKALLT
jgi:hypothetical protein